MGLDMDLLKVNKVTDETVDSIYWRKVNCVHAYFTRDWQERGYESDNCTDFDVTLEDLENLRDICEKIVATPSLGPSLLPTKSGFFFGSLEYDEWYLEDIKYTERELARILSEPLKDGEAYIYHAWY